MRILLLSLSAAMLILSSSFAAQTAEASSWGRHHGGHQSSHHNRHQPSHYNRHNSSHHRYRNRNSHNYGHNSYRPHYNRHNSSPSRHHSYGGRHRSYVDPASALLGGAIVYGIYESLRDDYDDDWD